MLAKLMHSHWMPRIREIHEDIVQTNYKSFIDSLMNCNFSADKFNGLEQALLDQIYQEMLKPNPRFNQFGIYDTPKIGVMIKRAQFLKDFVKIRGDALLFKPDINPYELESISVFLDKYSDTALLSVKMYVIAKGLEHAYDGIQPNTKPSRVACRYLTGCDFSKDRMGHTNLCREIAKALNMTPSDANTLLWLIGMDLK